MTISVESVSIPVWASNITYVYRTYWKAVFAFKCSFELTQACIISSEDKWTCSIHEDSFNQWDQHYLLLSNWRTHLLTFSSSSECSHFSFSISIRRAPLAQMTARHIVVWERHSLDWLLQSLSSFLQVWRCKVMPVQHTKTCMCKGM